MVHHQQYFRLWQTIMGKRKLSSKAKLSNYLLIYVPNVTCDQELWVLTGRLTLWIQAAKISFPHRVAGLSFRDRMRSSEWATPSHQQEPTKVFLAFD